MTMQVPIEKPSAEILALLFADAESRHHHLCPRIVLGVRLGLYGLRQLGLIDESYSRYVNRRKRLFAFAEIDGCGADGIATATDCWLVRRTLRHVDYGKLAATLVDRKTGRAVRVAPSADARDLALQYAPTARSRWHAYLEAYQLIPDELLITCKPVTLNLSLEQIVSRPGVRVDCDACGEEIVNERERLIDGKTLCRSCAGEGYYQ